MAEVAAMGTEGSEGLLELILHDVGIDLDGCKGAINREVLRQLDGSSSIGSGL